MNRADSSSYLAVKIAVLLEGFIICPENNFCSLRYGACLQAVQESFAATVANNTLQLETVANLTTSSPVKLAVSLAIVR